MVAATADVPEMMEGALMSKITRAKRKKLVLSFMV